jgi:hypothetical protein
LRKAVVTRNQMKLDRARWTFPICLRLCDFPELEDAEKARVFGEFKSYSYLYHKFMYEVIPSEFEDYKANIEENLFIID